MTLEHFTAAHEGCVGNAQRDKLQSVTSKHLHCQLWLQTSSQPSQASRHSFLLLSPSHTEKDLSPHNTSRRFSVLKTDLTSISQKSSSKSEARMKTVQMSMCIAVAQSQIYTAKMRIKRGTPTDVIASSAQRLSLVNWLQKQIGNPCCDCVSKRCWRVGCDCIIQLDITHSYIVFPFIIYQLFFKKFWKYANCIHNWYTEFEVKHL